MITPLTLHDALCDFIEEKIANCYMLKSVDSKGREYLKPPQVIRSGFLIPKSVRVKTSDSYELEFSVEEEIPFILPRIDKVENIKGERTSIVTFAVYFNLYDSGYDEQGNLVNDGSGYRDLWNLIEATRQAFWENLTIDSKYRLVEDFLEAEMLDEDTYPYWQGCLLTKWYVVFPQPKVNF